MMASEQQQIFTMVSHSLTHPLTKVLLGTPTVSIITVSGKIYNNIFQQKLGEKILILNPGKQSLLG